MAAAQAPSADAQPLRLRIDDVPLAAALETVRGKTGLDIVYADRLVAEQRASCTYTGRDREAALRCVLAETPLRAERVRRGQYVLVREDAASEGAASRPVPRVTLSGTVRDAETGESLPGAHVYLTALKAGAVTNGAGYFAVSGLPPGPYRVRISYLGFETVDTTLVAGRGAVDVPLQPTALQSEGVVVEAGSTSAADESRLPGKMSVALDRLEQLPSLGEPDLFRALQWTPGIRKSGIISGGLSVRGSNPDQNLYLLDGAPVYHPWHAFSLISTFQTGTLKNTDLYRGSFPASHGGRLSAVLDAQMKAGDRREPKATAALSVLSGRFQVEAPLNDQTSFLLSGRRSYIDKLVGRRHPVRGDDGTRDTLRTGYYFYDTSAKVAHRFNSAHRLSLSYYNGRDDLDLRLPFDLSLDFSSWLRPADLFFEVDQDWTNRIVSARHRYLPSDDLFLTSTAYYSGYRANEGSFVQPTTTASLTSSYSVRLDDVGVKVEADYYHSVAHEVTAGLQVSLFHFESQLQTVIQRAAGTQDRTNEDSRLDAAEVVGYVQDVWTPTPRWAVQPGLRVRYFSNGRYLHAAPRLSMRYTVHPRWLIVNGSAGVHVQSLHRLRDRYSLAYDLVSSRWIPSSPSVKPAESLHLGAGLRSQPTASLTLELNTYLRGARRMLVPADVFQTKDGIEGPGIEVGALLGQYTQAQERAFGTELTAFWNRGAWDVRLGVAAGRTFIRAEERSNERWRPADLDVPFSLRGAVSWSSPSWEATLGTELRSGYPLTEPTARYRLGDPVNGSTSYLYRPQINNGRLPAYLRLDASIAYRFALLGGRWKAKLNLYNATNRSNVVDRGFEPQPTRIRVNDQRGFPILPLLELEMTL